MVVRNSGTENVNEGGSIGFCNVSLRETKMSLVVDVLIEIVQLSFDFVT